MCFKHFSVFVSKKMIRLKFASYKKKNMLEDHVTVCTHEMVDFPLILFTTKLVTLGN